jgi:outer membrane protein OmpA-like peptidoglycan-associated protein
MQFTIKKTITRVTVLSALLPTLPWLAADAFAHDREAPTSKLDPAKAPARGSYAYDSPGLVVRSGVTRECVATGTWSIDTATPQCHPSFFASPMKPEPRTAAAPPPAAPQDAAAANEQAEPASAPAAYEPANYVEPAADAASAGAGAAAAAAAAVAATAAGVAGVADFAGEGDDPDMLPVPPAENLADAGDDLMAAPIVYGFEDGAVADDGIVSSQVYDDDAGTLADDGIVARQVFDDDSGAVADDGIVARQVFDDEGTVADDGILARQTFDDDGGIADDGILARQSFDDDAVADDGILARQVYDDGAGAVADDGILGLEQFAEEEEAAGPAMVEEADAGDAGPDNLIGEPTMFPDSPEPVAQAEEPAALAQAEPAKPVVLPVTITLGANALFDFDRSLVRTSDREKLDKLVDGLEGVNYDIIVVVGHADRIGTQTYNQRLSERRAKAVKAYLVKKGLGDERIQTEGRGKMEPVTDAKTCTGKHKKGLIECLQPDRRVEVTVTGQKPRQQ